LHYGQSIFEGMKAFRNNEGKIHVFRPQDHYNRLNASAERLCMPAIPEEVFMQGLIELLSLEKNWVPDIPGGALYIRPIYFATDEFLGMRPSLRYRLAIFCCPVNLYYAGNLNVYVSSNYVRASPGGIGYVKAAGNYARSLYINRIAQENGCNVVLWLDALQRKFIEEYSTMNAFFAIDDHIVTPKLTGTILAGITRDTAIQLLRKRGTTVYEREIAIDEILDMHLSGNLKEVFGTGTAAVTAPAKDLKYKDHYIEFSNSKTWNHFNYIYNTLNDIRLGNLPDEMNWLTPIP